MREIGAILGDRPIVVGRELTKAHQEFIRGTALELAGAFAAPRGEYTVVIGPSRPTEDATPPPSDHEVVSEFCYSTEVAGMKRREAINAIARKYRMPARTVYQIVEKLKNMGSDQ
jgi:16S rRNA (cytidine1402-2'-O)-methyltransferase